MFPVRIGLDPANKPPPLKFSIDFVLCVGIPYLTFESLAVAKPGYLNCFAATSNNLTDQQKSYPLFNCNNNFGVRCATVISQPTDRPDHLSISHIDFQRRLYDN